MTRHEAERIKQIVAEYFCGHCYIFHAHVGRQMLLDMAADENVTDDWTTPA